MDTQNTQSPQTPPVASPPQQQPQQSMSLDLRALLLSENYLTNVDMQKAEEYSQKNNVSLIDALLQNGLLTRDLLGSAIAEYFRVGYIDLQEETPPSKTVQEIPESIAKQFLIVLVRSTPTDALITCANPSMAGLGETLRQLFPGRNVKLAFSFADDITAQFASYRKELQTRFSEIINAQQRVAPEIIQQIIADGLSLHASDIHFEPQDGETVVRFRIDGVLQEAGRLPKETYENIVNRIKVQAHLRIDEHFTSQDGAIRFSFEKIYADMRVSIVPTLDGEKIVIRVLSEYVKNLSFHDLGLSKHDEELLSAASHKPFGMIVIAGPTGSGKSTTLYAMLKMLNKPTVNITTIEDPVEYKIKGINQIQVNNATNLTFAKGLKTIVRQDPDIILVGEVRDLETTEIAVNASLTGHLLFTTFHANDAATAIPRLLDMGVEPFLLSSTLELLVAQRLVRRLCTSCRFSKEVTVSQLGPHSQLLARYFTSPVIRVYEAKGCAVCNYTGFKGRIAIYEMIQITSQMQDLIVQKPKTADIWALARQQGSRSLFEDGLLKVSSGVTSLSELLRIAKIN